MIVCETCNIKLSGPKDQVAHEAGKRHRQAQGPLAQNVPQAPTNRNQPPSRRQNVGGRRAQDPSQSIPQINNPQNNRQPPQRPQQAGSFQPPQPTAHPGAQANTHQTPQTEPGPQANKEYEPDTRYDADFGVFLKPERGPHIRILEVTSDQRPEVEFFPIKPSRRASLAGYHLSSLALKSPKRYEICIEFNPIHARGGIHIIKVQAQVTAGPRTNQRWFKLKATVGKPEDHVELKPVSKYKKPDRVDDSNWHREQELRKNPLPRVTKFKNLPDYEVPAGYRREFVEVGDNRVVLESLLRSKLPHELNINTYWTRWKYLLWHEELQIEEDLKDYDMTRAAIRHVSGNNYSLDVPGLMEKRPSVIVTDVAAIRETGSGFGRLRYNKTAPYGGVVVKVQLSTLILRLPGDFPRISGPHWDVRFTVNRLLFRRMHDSVSKAQSHGRILFPSPTHQSKPPSGPQASLVLDRRIASNSQQSLAVRRIAAKPPGGIPFVIFGPQVLHPGTGKTTVLVESIRQVVDTQPKSRILVCAPSNAATDLIATRLINVGNYKPKQLIRLNAPSRDYDELPAALRDYSPTVIFENKNHFDTPEGAKLKEFRIVICTCYYASIPPAAHVKNHFTHIFVDEAGHAAESEIMVPILQNASSSTNIIVSGDPMQLGPIIQSKACIECDMDISFLERMVKLPVYAIKPGDTSNPNIVKLLQNYRSHPAILNYSNHAFYDSELEYCADPVLINSLVRFPELPKQGFPVIFHNICGENLREAKSPSFFNIEEATIVNRYIVALLDDRRWRLEPTQIGVITPYRQQCTKIKQLLSKKHGGVDVKVTENWQGQASVVAIVLSQSLILQQERRVIIISTVRSDPELLEDGAALFLGFVSSWRRTNGESILLNSLSVNTVALTRAQALLIVVGNGPVLELDPIWYFFMRFVNASGGWAGPGDIAAFIPDPANQQFEKLGKVNKDYENFIAQRRAKLNWAAKAESLRT